MIAFIDTSTLVKKYVEEQGSSNLEMALENVHEIVVAPIYLIELCSALRHKRNLKQISSAESDS